MSAIEPYVVNDETPVNIKKLIIRFPCALNVFRNIALGDNPAKNVFFESAEMLTEDDPIINFIIDELCKYKLCTKSGSSLKSNFSEIFLVKNSFTAEENRVYTANLLKQMSDTVLSPLHGDVKNFHLIGALSEQDLATMIEKVATGMGEVRGLPDGDKKFVATFVIKQF